MQNSWKDGKCAPCWYLENNGILAKQQCGYRANRSAVNHLIRLDTFISDAFIQNQHLVAVFFDLQKAYDTTWKHGIHQDLHDMGLQGNLCISIGNFLTDRTFQIHLGTILSDVFHGIHQDLHDMGLQGNLCISIGNFLTDRTFQIHLGTILSDVFHGIHQDLHDMGLQGNLPIFIGNFLTDRTFLIHLGTILSDVFHQEEGVPHGAILSTTLFNVKINDIVKHVDPEPHIKYLKARCQKSLNILKVLSRTEWGADRTKLLKLYRSLVRSKLDYGCIVYGSASKTALAKLDPVHNQGLRLSLGAFRSSPVESLYVEAHEPPLEIRRDKLALQYVIKLKANPENPAYNVVFNPKHQELYKDKESATDSFKIHCKKLLKEAQIDVGEIAVNSIPDVPIWDSKPVTVD